MAQTASDGYKAAAVAQFRRPVQKVEIEWAPGVWTDESAYVLEMSGDSRTAARDAGPSALGPGIADALNVSFRNTNGHFNGADYDGFGKRIRVSIGFTWVVQPPFADWSALIDDTAPVAWWRLGEASGQLQDSSGNGNHTTGIQGVTYGVTGALADDADTAIQAEGGVTPNLGTVPNDATLQIDTAITFECWAKPTIPAPRNRFNRIVEKDESYRFGLQESVGFGAWWSFMIYGGGSWHSLPINDGTLTNGQWHHVVMVYDGAVLTLYVNGVQATETLSYAGGINVNANDLYLFNEGGMGPTSFDWPLDEIALYDRALTPEEIAAHYEMGHTGPAAPFDTTAYLPQFIGYLQEPAYQAVPATVRFAALDYAGKAVVHETSTPVYEDLRSDEYLEALAGLLNPAVTWDTDHPHPGTNQIAFAWLDNEPVWEEMQRVASAEGGRLYFAKGTGLLRFEPYSDLLLAEPEPVATLTTARFSNLNRRRDWQNARNHIQVQHRIRYRGGEQVVWQSPDTIHLLPGASYDVAAQFDVPVLQGTLLDPVAGVDYVARSAAYGAFTNEVASEVIGTPSAQHATIRLANANTTKSRYVENLQLRGVPVLAGPQQLAQSIDSSWDAVYGRRVLTFENVFIQEAAQAQAVVQMLRDRYAQPRIVFDVSDSPGQPWLELGDLVTVTDRFGADVDAYIVGIAWSWQQGYKATYTLAEAAGVAPHDPGDYFIVGIDALGETKRAWY